MLSCTFVILYENTTKDQFELTLNSVIEFARNHKHSTSYNPFDLLIICGDSVRGTIGEISKSEFESVKISDRSDWTLPGEQESGIGSVMFNLGLIALKRVSGTILLLPCGRVISDSQITLKNLLHVEEYPKIASLSISSDSNDNLVPTGIIFKKVAGWDNLATAIYSTIVKFKKRFFGGFKMQIIENNAPESYSDSQLIGSIAFDYFRDRNNYGFNVIYGNWAE